MHTHHHKRATAAQSGHYEATTATRATATSGDKGHTAQSVAMEAIRLCAYQKWESAGKPSGDGVQFWVEAEHELVHEK